MREIDPAECIAFYLLVPVEYQYSRSELICSDQMNSDDIWALACYHTRWLICFFLSLISVCSTVLWSSPLTIHKWCQFKSGIFYFTVTDLLVIWLWFFFFLLPLSSLKFQLFERYYLRSIYLRSFSFSDDNAWLLFKQSFRMTWLQTKVAS